MNLLKNFLKEEEGVGTVEIVLILVALVAVALLFKDTVMGYVTKLLNSISGDIDGVTGEN